MRKKGDGAGLRMALCFSFCGVETLAAGEFADMTRMEAHWFWSLLAEPGIETILAGLATVIIGVAARWQWVRKWRVDKALECIAAGVQETHEEYVKQIKEAKEDGKLTVEERAIAMLLALEKAKRYALLAGFDLVKVFAEDRLPALAESALEAQKAAGKDTGYSKTPTQ